jgi:NADPH:quinone reductase-like Zn-dependent oxidoreductase
MGGSRSTHRIYRSTGAFGFHSAVMRQVKEFKRGVTVAISSTNTVLVTGATGNTGAVLLRLLEQQGIAVRAMLRLQRDVARLGNTSASIVIADFEMPTPSPRSKKNAWAAGHLEPLAGHRCEEPFNRPRD